MININNVSMGFTQRTLFKDVTLSIFPNEKIGLTGPNGTGKTTLFSIILGDMEPVEGNVTVQKNINIGYLPQESKFNSTKSVIEELTEGDDRIKNLVREKRMLEDEHKADTDRYGDVLHELEQLGIYEIEHKAEKVLTGLGFKEEDFRKPIAQLSGGWQMRTLLAKLLVYPFDLLLLDEPTNYLDLEATLWFKDYLTSYQGAFMLISHDRVFLNDVTNYTIVLEAQQMIKIKGNYASYEQQRDTNSKTLEKKQKVVEKKRQQLERFTQRFHAQPNRAAAVRNKRKMIERLEKIEITHAPKSVGDFEFSDIPPSGYVTVRCDQISKSYGQKLVYRNLNLEIIRGEKVCLVGPNGAGKSTLLKMLAGAIEPTEGSVKLGHQVERGYFSQTRTDVLNPNRSAFDEVASCCAQGAPALRIRSLLGLFNFHGDDVFKPVNVLSGGEKSRLILAKLLINPPNFMLLDEPTTHLDLDGVKALTGAFQKFNGTIVFISHDLYFIKEIADHIIDVKDGNIRHYLGGLEYYLEKRGENNFVEQKKVKHEKGEKLSEKDGSKEDGDDVGDGKLTNLYHQHKQAKKRISQIRNEVKNLEDEKKALEVESYVKSRHLSKSFDQKDSSTLKDYGQRLKAIQSRLREIETTIAMLNEEKNTISK